MLKKKLLIRIFYFILTHQQIIVAIPEGNARVIATNNPENSTFSHSIPSQNIIQHSENNSIDQPEKTASNVEK